MRYQCDYEGFENCYVEVSKKWTRGELKLYFRAKGDEYMELLRSKIAAIYLVTNGDPIDQPDKLTEEASDNVDVTLWRWFATAVNKAVDDMATLGEASARRWLETQDKSASAPNSPTLH